MELYNVVVQIQLTTSKRNVIPSIANYVYQLPHEYSNDLRKLGNIKKIPNLGGEIAQCLVPLPEIKFGNSSQKACTNRYQGFSCTVHFFWISLFCSKYLVRDCSSLETLSWLFKSLLWCQKKVVAGMESEQTYYVFHIPHTNSEISMGLLYIRHTSFDDTDLKFVTGWFPFWSMRR